jgi:hypothetical protein
VLTRERFALAFPVQRPFGVHGVDADNLRISVTGFGNGGRRLDSIGLQLLFWNRPHDQSFEPDLAAADTFLRRIALPPEAVAAAMARLRSLADGPHTAFVPMPRRNEAAAAGGLLIHVRGRFSGGPGGQAGMVLIQFTRADAPQAGWPTVQDVAELQPVDGRPMLSSRSDLPLILDWSVADLACFKARGALVRCRYTLTVDDWIGADRPRERHVDFFRRNAAGAWVMEARGPYVKE